MSCETSRRVGWSLVSSSQAHWFLPRDKSRTSWNIVIIGILKTSCLQSADLIASRNWKNPLNFHVTASGNQCLHDLILNFSNLMTVFLCTSGVDPYFPKWCFQFFRPSDLPSGLYTVFPPFLLCLWSRDFINWWSLCCFLRVWLTGRIKLKFGMKMIDKNSSDFLSCAFEEDDCSGLLLVFGQTSIAWILELGRWGKGEDYWPGFCFVLFCFLEQLLLSDGSKGW